MSISFDHHGAMLLKDKGNANSSNSNMCFLSPKVLQISQLHEISAINEGKLTEVERMGLLSKMPYRENCLHNQTIAVSYAEIKSLTNAQTKPECFTDLQKQKFYLSS